MFNKALDWKFFPTTINTWLNWYTNQWDEYLDLFPFINEKITNLTCLNGIYFRRPNNISLKIYRKICQFIDYVIFDHNYYIFNYRFIVASSMFLIIGEYYQVFESFEKVTELNYLNMICFRAKNIISEVFIEFIINRFEIKIQELYFPIIYLSKLFSLDSYFYEPPLTLEDSSRVYFN